MPLCTAIEPDNHLWEFFLSLLFRGDGGRRGRFFQDIDLVVLWIRRFPMILSPITVRSEYSDINLHPGSGRVTYILAPGPLLVTLPSLSPHFPSPRPAITTRESPYMHACMHVCMYIYGCRARSIKRLIFVALDNWPPIYLWYPSTKGRISLQDRKLQAGKGCSAAYILYIYEFFTARSSVLCNLSLPF